MLHVVQLPNVPNAISLDVAKFAEGVENDYSKIYGSTTKNGAKNLYCKVVAYDGAKRYPEDGSNQSPEDLRGNVTSTYYMYEDIATSILSNHKITEVYHMLNGSYLTADTSRSVETVNAVTSLLNSKVVSTGRFSLNPANNPTFSVSGRDPLVKDGNDFAGNNNDITNGASVVIEVATGLDAIPLNGDSLKVYALPCDANGVATSSTSLYPVTVSSKSGTSYKFVTTITNNEGFVIGNNYLFGVEGTDQSGNPVVASKSAYGFHFAHSGAAPSFRDVVVSVNDKPSDSVSIVYASEKKDDGTNSLLKYSGKIVTDAPSVSLKFMIDNGEATSDGVTVNVIDSANGIYSFEKTVSTSSFADSANSKEHTITLVADNGTKSEITSTVMYDCKGPKISFDESATTIAKKYIDEDATDDGNRYLNGTVKFKFSVIDADKGDTGVNTTDKKPYMIIAGSDGVEISTSKYEFDTPSSQDVTVDTTAYPYGNIYVRVYAWDKAGNSYKDEVTGKPYYEEVFIVDQNTDKPFVATDDKSVIQFANAASKDDVVKIKAGEKTGVTGKPNLIEKNSTVSFNLYDDDGLSKYEFKVAKESEIEGVPGPFEIPFGHYDVEGTPGKTISGKTKTITYVPQKAGYYFCSLQTWDSAGNASDKREFWILVTGFAPVVTVNKNIETITLQSDADKKLSAKESFTNEIDIDSSDGPFTIKTVEKESGGTIEKTLVTSYASTKYTHTFVPSSGRSENKVTYIVTDSNEHSGERVVSYQIDSTGPVVKADTIKLPTAKATESNSISFAAEFEDKKPSSNPAPAETTTGVSKVQYSWDNSTWKTSNETSLNITVYPSEETGFDNTTEGTKNIYFRAIDAVGNIGEATSKTFVYDKASPKLTLTNKPNSLPSEAYTLNGVIVESNDMHKLTQTEIDSDPNKALNKNTSDELTAIKDNYYVKVTELIGDTVKATKYVSLEKAGTNYSFSLSLPITDGLDGDITYKFETRDICEWKDESNVTQYKNLTGDTEFTANRDITAPVITVTTPSSSTFGEGSISTETSVFRGTIKEVHPNVLYYQKIKDGAGSAPTALTTADVTSNAVPAAWTVVDISKISTDGEGNGDWNFTTNFDSNAADRDGKYKLYIQSADKGGNITAMQTIPFAVDSAVPSITDYAVYKKTAAGDTLASNSTSYTLKDTDAEGYIIKFKVSDNNGLKTVTVNGKTTAQDTKFSLSNGEYSYGPVTDPGTETYVIYAEDNSGRVKQGTETKDISGKTSTVSATVIYDNQAPQISTTSADLSSNYVNGTSQWFKDTEETYINGTTTDIGSGLKQVQIKVVKKGETASAVSYSDLPLTQNWSYSYSIPNDLAENTDSNDDYHTIMLRAVDNADNETIKTYYFRYDKEAPKLTLESTSEYVNASSTTSVTLSGNANDGTTRKVKSLVLTAQKYNKTNNKYEDVTPSPALPTATPSDGTDGHSFGDYTYTITNAIDDGKYKFIVTATDYANNHVKQETIVTIDKVLPTASADFAETAPYSVNVMEEDNVTIKEIQKWYKSKQVKIKVTSLVDETSGIKSVEAKGFSGEPASPDLSTGLITLSSNGSGGYEGSVEVPDEGKNTIYVVITDYAGNISKYTIPVYVDTEAPDSDELKLIAVDGKENEVSKLTNRKNPVTVIMELKDKDSRTPIKTVKLAKIGAKSSDAAVIDATKETELKTSYTNLASKTLQGKWLLTIDKDDIPNNSGSLGIRVEDSVGNYVIYTPFTFRVDTTAPEVSFGTIKDSDLTTTDKTDVNKEISIPVNSSDDQGLKETVLKYFVGATAPSDWSAESATIPITNSTAVFDTSSYDNENLYLYLTAEDEAGNPATPKTKTLYINQNSDRPVIKFTNLTEYKDTYILKFGEDSKLEGSVTDDDENEDGIVSLFVASNTQLTAAPTGSGDGWTKSGTAPEEIWTHATYGKTVFNKSTGEYSYTPADTTDGTKEVYFYVEDNYVKNNAHSVFYTGNSTDLTKPYQQYKTTAKVSNAEKLVYNSDSTNPEVKDVLLLAYNSTGTAEGEAGAPGTSVVLGGTKKKFAGFVIKAYDANEIENVTIELNYKKKSDGSDGSIKLTLKDTTGFKTSGSYELSTDGETYIASSDKVTGTKYPYVKWTVGNIDLTTPANTDIDISTMETGSVEGTIMVYDKSDMYGNRAITFMADNDGPAIEVTTPALGDESSGEVSFGGTTADKGNSGAATIEWFVPTATQRALSDDEIKALNKDSDGNSIWNDTRADSSTVANWKFKSFFLDKSKGDIPAAGATTGTYWTAKTAEGVYTIPVYFRSVDNLGNISLKKNYTLTYNPDADKPKTEIAYPATSDYDKDESGTSKGFVTLGGTIRISGSVNIPSGLTTPYAVYVQISDNDGNFDATDKEKAGSGDGNYGYTVVTQSEVAAELSKDALTGFESDTLKDNWWGIKANRSSNSWSINLNSDEKMNPTAANTTNNIKIRACGVNAEGKVGNWSEPVSIHIDNTAPSYTTTLFKYSNLDSLTTGEAFYVASATEEKGYTTGIYLKGEWVLRVRIVDETAVYVPDNAVKKAVGSNSNNITYYVSNEKSETENGKSVKVKYVYIPLDSSATQTTTYSLTAYDNSNPAASGTHVIYPAYEINMDNTAPTLTLLKTTSGTAVGGTKVTNSNYESNFATNADDGNGSGFRMMAYYFKRTVGPTTTIELPLPKAVSGGWTAGEKYVGNTSALTTDSNLFGVSLSGEISYDSATDKTTFTAEKVGETLLTDLSAYPFIRVGSIINLEGTYYTVSAVSGLAITVDTKLTAKTNATAFAAAAFVVDNTNAEVSTWSSGTNTISLDDGDGVFEFMKKTGTNYSLEFGVCADELDDGPIQLCCVAFDAAGNYTGQELGGTPLTSSIFLANHTPRLSKVYLATDLNGNGTYSDDEFGTSTVNGSTFKYYSALTDGGALQAAVTITDGTSTTTGITMRDKLGVALEFVSGYNTTTHAKEYEGYGAGNGDVYYKLGVSNAALTAAATKASGETLSSKIAAMTDKFTGTTGAVASALKGFEIPTTTDGLSTYEDIVSGCYINVSLWDSTPGTTIGANDSGSGDSKLWGSQWTVLNIPVKVDVTDDVKPTVTINNPQAKISTSQEDVLDDDGNATGDKETVTRTLGHVDLETTPNVSGKVVFTGKVNDEKRISSLKLTSTNPFSKVKISSLNVGSYDSTKGYVTHPNDDDYNGIYSIEIATGVIFEVTSQTFDISDGHTIEWKLEVDTETVGTESDILAAESGVAFTLTAGNSGDTAGTDVTEKTKTVNIVPYVTALSTSLDEYYEGNASVYSRTARGHYIAYDKETLNMTGFNLKQGATVTFGNNKTATLGALANGKYPFTIPADAKSGKLKVTVNDVDSVNNTNDNNAETTYFGSETVVKQNMQANGVNNDNLTDDLELDIWEFKTAANPRDGEILTPEMQIGPNGEVGFAFVNGNFYFNMAGPSKVGDISTTASTTFASQRAYERDYAPYYESAFTFDPTGHTFGISTNQDANDPYSAYTTFYFGRRAGSKGAPGNDEGWYKTASNYSGGTYRRRIQSTTSTVLSTGNIQDTSVYRAMSPSISATIGTNGRTNVYMAFYDAVRKEIRYKYGIVDAVNEDLLKGTVQTNKTDSHKFTGSINGNSVTYYAIDFYDGTDGRYAHVIYPTEVLFEGNIENGKLYEWKDNKWNEKAAGYGGGQKVTLFDYEGKPIGTYQTGKNTWKNPSTGEQFFTIHKLTDDQYQISSENDAIHPFPANAVYVCAGEYTDKLILDNTAFYSTITTTANHGLNTGDVITLSQNLGNYDYQKLVPYYYVHKIDDKNFTVSLSKNGAKCITWPFLSIGGKFDSRSFTVYINKIEGQLLDATNGWGAAGTYPTKTADASVDGSVDESLYSVVSTASLTKTTASVAIGAVPAAVANNAGKDVACVAWYDGKKLCYAYSTNPQSDDGATAGSNFTKVGSLPSKFTGAGYNVKMKVDTDGGIHLAFFTTSGAKLRYAYAPSYQGNFTVVDVDNYSLTTNDIGLDVAKDGSGNIVPYISYLSGNQLAKVAFPVDWNSNKATKAGINNSKYTGYWEISVVPSTGYSTTNNYTAKTVTVDTSLVNLTPKFDTICIGVHKNWSDTNKGVIQNIPEVTTKINVSSDDKDTNYSTRIGGNGSSNPALAYTVVGDDSLQFVQMK